MIHYSIAVRKTHPGDETNTETKAYGVAQVRKILTMEQFAEHISLHGSLYGKDLIEGVLAKCVNCLRELLVEGKRISLGDLGTFFYTFSSTGAATAALCSDKNIKAVNARWRGGSKFRNLRKDATFKLVPSREAQAEALAEARLQATQQ